ncbi:cytokinesis protein 3 [Verticillium nonalfalfae]|uniref:Cytokinesis protein 3 n=2 Tax=Verticillium TaxID=1036719 RepID=A0A3M9XZ83_9PEZI|nr:cytokinesis protein 3 [Verticillium nonalfalfae]RNJ53092.1 cytokinesis protein 3 [Verticillium nonalfalfae]
MVPAPPPLPTQFPCWCRAVYSWGGESKRDLGFIEGDLIECLNAGDGSWWTGKLWRDRRTVGVFPSNFVELLPPNFRPTTRSVSPLPDNTPGPKPVPQKSKTFRKPFEAYAKAPHYTTAKQPEVVRESPHTRARDNSASSYQPPAHLGRSPSPAPPLQHHRSYDARAPSPAPHQQYGSYNSRAPSPAPPPQQQHRYDYRAASPAPPQQRSYDFRAASPAPPQPRSYDFRAASPAPPPQRNHDFRAASPAPPQQQHHRNDFRAASPAPPHHVDYGSRAPSPAPPQAYQQHPRALSPAPPPQDYHRAASPAPPPPSHHHHGSYGSRAPSPAPSFGYNHHSRAPSPAPPLARSVSPVPSFIDTYHKETYDEPAREDSPPPPPPPPHRHVNASRNSIHPSQEPRYAGGGRHGSNLSYEHRQDGLQTPRMPSPCPPSPGGSHMTPSPLREAMDGVIEQLDALGMPRDTRTPEPAPLDPWSPECFDMVSHRARNKAAQRPQTSMGLGHQDEGYETWSGGSSQEASYQNGQREDAHDAPQLSNYVERMETRLQGLQHSNSTTSHDEPPPPPPKGNLYQRPKSSMGEAPAPEKKVRTRKSAYDVGRNVLGRSFTTKTNSTSASSGNQSATTQSTNRSLMSGVSAGAISATSAGSLARKNERRERAQSALGVRDLDIDRPDSPFTGVTYHSSHASDASRPKSQAGFNDEMGSGLGGLVQPRAPKRSLFKKLFDTAKTGVATSRSNLGSGGDLARPSPFSRSTTVASPATSGMSSMTGLGSSSVGRNAAKEMGLGSGVDWVQVRRDINRSNSLSKIERHERQDRCQMLDHPALNPVDELYQGAEGDEGANGMPVDDPIDYQSINLSQVDKSTRFISSLPPLTTAVTLATSYVCRPYRSDVQRMRAIFSWVSERIAWEEDFEGEIDTRRVIQSRRACVEEYAVLVMEMCAAVGIECEVVRGYLKTPGETPDFGIMPRSNHWWNAVLVDNEWRMVDCCLASPSNPRRHLYSGAGNSAADSWWFLTRPTQLCWTHIPEHHEQQHICPPQAHEVLLNLPCACSPYFKNMMQMVDYNTSLTRIEDLEMVHIKFNVPADVEVAAEVEVRAYSRDQDGDVFESGEMVKKRALAQAEWSNGYKRYTVKALLPGDEGQGVLKVYAGKRGLMHSIKDIPHPMAFALPITHTGENPPYDFVTRHPTPHAQRHDIYVVQPQCQRLALNNTFVFAIRQHPSSAIVDSIMTPASNPGAASPIPFARPSSAMSMTASSASGSNPSTVSGNKPAKLAIQTPAGKILRLMRKDDRKGIGVGGRNTRDEEGSDGGTWETIIKCSEKGVWRGLVLADRTARWCVFAEWVCLG